MDSLRVLYLVILIVACASAHSYLTNPVSRGNQKQTQSGCRGPSCSVCELPASSASANPTVIARGAPISVQWPRNNHPGGFVRIAWALTAQSDSATAFDAGSQVISCFEQGDAGCAPASSADPNGGDISTATQTSCFVDITVPTWLSDGKWTMQWSWFGGGFALADYFGCVDYQISGGPTGTQTSEYFIGGDYANAGTTACKYFNTNYLGACPAEPCPNPPMSGQHNGAPRMTGNGTAPPPPPPPPAAVTTAYPTPYATTKGATTGLYIPPPPPPPPAPPAVYTTGLVQLTSGANVGDVSNKIPCTSNDDCSSGVCGIDGYCTDTPSSGLGSGGIAAIVMAAIFVVLVAVFAIFFVINKSEIPYMQPFRGRV